MKENNLRSESSKVVFQELDSWLRLKIQDFIQQLLEEEVCELLGRSKSQRLNGIDSSTGYRNGYGKPRKFTTGGGTITVRRPRVRNLDERFESRIIPLFERRTHQVAELIPELYLHGLSQGDFDLALRGLLGEQAPLSSATVARLKARWQLEYEQWKQSSPGEARSSLSVGRWGLCPSRTRKRESLFASGYSGPIGRAKNLCSLRAWL
jgi:transposase-like protein